MNFVAFWVADSLNVVSQHASLEHGLEMAEKKF